MSLFILQLFAGLNAMRGEVVTNGWTTKTGATVLDQMEALAPHVGGFLVTAVEREGHMGGVDLKTCAEVRAADRILLNESSIFQRLLAPQCHPYHSRIL